MTRSLRLRVMLAAALLAVLFMLGLLPALQGAVGLALKEAIEQRLASDVTTLISAARVEGGQLHMPAQLPDERFNLPDGRLLGYIYDRRGKRVWQSRAAAEENVAYTPSYDGLGNEFSRAKGDDGREYWVYDVEVKLLGGENAAYSFLALQSVDDYQNTLKSLREHFYLGFGAALLVLLVLLWAGLTWALRSLGRMSRELDAVEAGERQSLSDDHPRELLRLTRSLNRLLHSEREQRTRYRDSLGDLAHSLKTPLAVLQGVSENIAQRGHSLDQALILQQQVERMSQQIGYQLQRASLRKSGLVRHQVALQPQAERVCATLSKVYRDKPVQVQYRIEAPGRLPMEEAALLELLGNLLENAYRLCLGRIDIVLQQDAHSLLLCVEDDGPGIPPSQRARILQRGERLDTQHPGQGIGLAVVNDIIDSYGAQLVLDDAALGGAAFRIRFRLG